jgi:hypothetical protein
MNQRLYRLLALPAVVFLLNATLVPAVAMAQWDDEDDGFTFDEEEADDFGDPMEFGEDDDWGDEDDGWDDWEDDADDGWGDEEEDDQPVALDTITALVVPSAAFDAALADSLTNAVMNELMSFEGVTVVTNEGLREEFEIMGAELAFECAFDPVCLGRYGRELGLGQIVVGRVNANETGGWGTTVDLFDTANSSITNYRYFETEARMLAVTEALPSELRMLFGIREDRTGNGAGRTGPSTAQTALAWTTAGLAVASVATGIVFGLAAKSTDNDLADCTLTEDFEGEPVCDLTQRDAAVLIDDGRRDATLSNVFIGGGLFLGVISVVLFTVTPGGDIDEDAELARRNRDWSVSPTVSREGLGFAGAWSF